MGETEAAVTRGDVPWPRIGRLNMLRYRFSLDVSEYYYNSNENPSRIWCGCVCVVINKLFLKFTWKSNK